MTQVGCPLDYFENAPLRPAADANSRFMPGSIVGSVLAEIGYTKSSGCGCAAFAEKMNAWGWWGCFFKHRREIIEWFTAKAREQGIDVDEATVWKLIKAGFKDQMKRRFTGV